MKDQLGRIVPCTENPVRIVSVVPSQTELLYDLGLRDEVVGITRFCIHPRTWFKTKTRVGGTKKLNFEKILLLKPDLILANKEENTLEDILELEKFCPVWVSDIHHFADAIEMIQSVGRMVRKVSEADLLIEKIISAKENFERTFKKRYTVMYMIWENPFMAAGCDTFIHEMLTIAGFDNVCKEARYPVVDMDSLKGSAPELVFLSSEPFPFKQKHLDKMKLNLPDSKIILVDGELFSWYGSRMLKSFDYFSALHGQIQKI